MSHSQPPTSPGGSPGPSGVSDPGSYGALYSLLFPYVLVHMRVCVCPLRVEFLFSSVLWSSCSHSLLAFKATVLGSLLPMPDPKAEAPVLGLRILTPLGEFCDVIIFQFGWKMLLAGMDLIVLWMHSSYCLMASFLKYNYTLFLFIYYGLLFWPCHIACGMEDLSSPTSYQTHSPSSGSMEF